MKRNTYRGEWCSRSDIPNRTERMAAHIEFEQSELKKKLDAGWQVESAKVKRPRIKREKPVFRMFGTFECKFEIPIEVLIKAGFYK